MADVLAVSSLQATNQPEVAVDKLLLTTTEAAEALGICRSKIYELFRAGRLESVRIDGSRRVPAVVLEEFVDRLRNCGDAI